MKIGSLCTGYGGLDLAVEAFYGARTIWCAETDKYASQVIEQRFDIPNYGDIKTINWASVEPIDILTAGYPCQPFSHAGERKGTNDDRHLFPYIAQAISALRPRIVVLENVRGHLSLGLKEVLACLANIGYDTKWHLVRASDCGAPHKRARIFIVAHANSHACKESRRAFGSVQGEAGEVIYGSNWAINGRCCEDAGNTNNQHKPHDRKMSELGRRFTSRHNMHMQAAPDALDKAGKLNAEFVEYMMGLPGGWVTQTGLSRAQQLKMLGNGVVPQQAEYALEILEGL